MGLGSHQVIYTISGQCGDADTVMVTIVSSLDATIDSIGDICSNTVPFNLTAANPGGVWTGDGIVDGSQGTFNPAVAGDGPHTIIYTISGSCGDTDTAEMNVINCDVNPVLYVPNIFSPNGDGNNDVLYVHGQGIESLQFIVYDRWGEKVFETTDNTQGWDGKFRGKDMEPAVFMYYLKAKMNNDEELKWKGSITLVR
jgi:gliding motility-associated-like protein